MKRHFLSFAVIVLLAGGLLAVVDKEDAWSGADLEGFIRKTLEKQELTRRFKDLVGFMGKYTRRFRTPQVFKEIEYIQAHPLETATRARAITDPLKEHLFEKADLPAAMAHIGEKCDAKFSLSTEGLKTNLTAEKHLDQIAKLLERAAGLREEALKGLSREEREFLYGQAPELAGQFAKHIYIDVNRSTLQSNVRAVKLSRKIDYGKFHAAAAILLELADRKFLDGLRKDLRKARSSHKGGNVPGVKGKVLHVRDTRLGKIIVGGKGSNTYELNALAIIDVGGKDTYKGGAAGAVQGRPVSIVVDLAGNDTYTGGGFAQGVGFLGLGLLIDRAGNDRYKAGRFAQGCGLFGVGVLVDYAGRDTYEGTEFVQGAGLFGTGLLLDLKDDDTYTAFLYSQGFGLTRGFGLLADAEGGNTLKATGKYPSTYGDKSEYHGGSRGFGIGLRSSRLKAIAGGGIGVLLTGSGDDTYIAGEFGLGGGYFFGLGIVHDSAGNDTYNSSRYGASFGVHNAIGVLMDDDGDDTYNARSTATQAGTWDAGIAFLVDGGGDDTYNGKGICQGSATITSLSVLADLGGNDTYRGNSARGGHPKDSERKTLSFGFLFDFGGGKDTFSTSEHRNNTTYVNESRGKDGRPNGFGVFVDTVKKLK